MKWPQGWREVSILDVCELNPSLSRDERPSDDTLVSFVPMSAVDEEQGVIASAEQRPFVEVQKGYTPFRDGDVLFAKVTPCMENGKAAIAESLSNGFGFGSTEFHVLRPNTQLVLPEYVLRFVRQPWFREQAAASFVGTGGLQRVPAGFFKRVKLPLPPLPEQQRIVEGLAELSAIEQQSLISKEDLRALARHEFLRLFGHPAANLKGFEVLPLDALGTLDRGVSKHRPRDAEHLFGGPYPFIQTGDVARAGDWITSYERTYSGAGLAQSRLWPRGTLCITIAANIGKTAILGFDGCFPDSVVGFKPNDGVTSEYVSYCLRFFQELLEWRAPKSAQMNINLDTLRKLRIPCPPADLQQQFATFLRELRTIEALIQARGATLDKLRLAMMSEALSGRLTGAWREQHAPTLAEAVRVRDEALGAPASRVKVQITKHAVPKRNTGFARPRRQALVDHLSNFQNEVWNTLRFEWRGAVLADDPVVFEDFCTSPQTAWRLEGFNAGREGVRRALEQLAALGLIRKMSLPRKNPITGRTEYLTAFRPLREAEDSARAEEDTALADAERLARALARQAQEEG